MNNQNLTDQSARDAHIAASLADVCAWRAGDTELWNRAWDQEHGAQAWWKRGRTWGLSAAAALVLVSGTVVWRGMGVANGIAPAAITADFRGERVQAARKAYAMEVDRGYADKVVALGGEVARVPADAQVRATVSPSTPALPLQPVATPSQDRFVVRRATMELETRDVHAVFAKCSLLPNAALGEFIETSSISGDGDEARAEVTLRVTADRLSSVLNELRGFATITSEQSGGQDITDQVVDIDARLRNEQRIEQELLALLTSKKDASLEDVLRVQQELSRVREQIERMQAQRDSLGRLASLATVLVIIRHEGGPQQPPPNSFKEAMGRAWSRGVDDLGGFVGGAVRLAVGGLPVWVVVGAGAVVAWRTWKRKRAAMANEPAPRLPG